MAQTNLPPRCLGIKLAISMGSCFWKVLAGVAQNSVRGRWLVNTVETQGPELDFSPCPGFVQQYETSFWSHFLPASEGSSEQLLLLGQEGRPEPNLPVFTLYDYLKIQMLGVSMTIPVKQSRHEQHLRHLHTKLAKLPAKANSAPCPSAEKEVWVFFLKTPLFLVVVAKKTFQA